jgi:hypothetical protein
MMGTVDSQQRYTRTRSCPVCGGYDGGKRGAGNGPHHHCHGFLSTDGRYARCSRAEYAADALYEEKTTTWVHRLDSGDQAATASYSASNEQRRIVAAYDYRDEAGTLLYQAVRYLPKGFTQRQPDGSGGWLWNIKEVRLVLYRLPELLIANPAATVFIPEGEKDVENLWMLGVVATCNAMGAGKWRAEYNEFLRGRQVVLLPDHDKAGAGHTRTVANVLTGIAASVKVLNLPGLPDKGDVSDWLTSGGTAERLTALADATPAYAPETDSVSRDRNASGFRFSTLDDLLAEPEEEVAYVWERTLPAGGISICAAKPKVGKSTCVRNLVVAVLRGTPFFGRAITPGAVVYLCLEEKRAEIAGHFRRMGASGGNLYIHTGRAPDDALAALTVAIAEYRPVLAVIDPLSRFVRLNDANAYAEVARAMEPIIDLARTSGCHIICVHHAGKGERTGGDALLGSTALFAAVDTLLMMKRRDQVRTIETMQRYGEDMEETVVYLDTETGIVTPGGDLATMLMEQAQVAVLAAMGNDTLTEPDIRARVGGNESTTGKALRALVDEGKVARTGKGKRGDPYQYRRAGVSEEGKAAEPEREEAADEDSADSRFSRFPSNANQENQENQSTGAAYDPADVAICRAWLLGSVLAMTSVQVAAARRLLGIGEGAFGDVRVWRARLAEVCRVDMTDQESGAA